MFKVIWASTFVEFLSKFLDWHENKVTIGIPQYTVMSTHYFIFLCGILYPLSLYAVVPNLGVLFDCIMHSMYRGPQGAPQGGRGWPPPYHLHTHTTTKKKKKERLKEKKGGKGKREKGKKEKKEEEKGKLSRPIPIIGRKQGHFEKERVKLNRKRTPKNLGVKKVFKINDW